MTVYIPTGWTAGPNVADNYRLGLALPAEEVVIPDLWYERRKGVSLRADLKQKVYHTTAGSRGRYSALCHAKPKKDYMIIPLQRESSFMPLGVLQFLNRHTGEYVYTGAIRLEDFAGRNSLYCQMAYYLNAEDGLVVSCRISVTFSGPISSNPKYQVTVDARCITSATIRTDGKLRYEVRTKNIIGKVQYTGIDNWNASNIQGDAAMLVSSYLAQHPFSEWDRSTGTKNPEDWFRGDEPDYIKAQINLSLHSALKLDDLALVDYSVRPRGPRPWAFGDINLITGRAAAYTDCLGDIPNECDNALQNIVMAVSALEAIATGSSKAFAKWLDKQNWTTDADMVRRLSSKNWYQTNARGLSKLERLAKQFHRDWTYLLDKTGIDEMLAAKEEGFGDLSSSWLKGRYVFSTTVMDLGQSWDYWYDQALHWIGKRSNDYKCHGKAELDFGTFQCTCVLHERALQGITKCFEEAYRHGLEPNGYVLWDFIPFSFVVDWFYPIGDALLGYTRACHFTPELWEYVPEYDGNAMCYSVAYSSQVPILGEVSVYTRWYEPSPPEVEPAYILQAERQSARNVIPRSGVTADGTDLSVQRQSSRFDRDARRTVDVIALL